MPYFRTDDQMHGHPKARRAGLAALGLWNMSGSHSMAYKTNGFIPQWFVASWPGGQRAANTLVTVGLWSESERDGEAGYEFHDWLDYQPSADEIERDRERARERARESRRRLRDGKKTDKKEEPPA